MDPTCGLGEKLRDIVLNVIGENLLYLICYGQNVEQLKEELVRLTNERSSIQLRIDEARNNVEQIVDNVLHWLDEVNKISEQAEQLHKESQSKRECTITSCPNPWLRYKLSKRAKAMAQQVADINGRANFPKVAIRVPPPPMLELPTGVNNEGIDSRVQIKSQIIDALRDPSVKMVGLCGLGGVGKTTIAKDVVKEEEIQKMFENVIMATVSQEMNIGKIQDQIIDNLGMKRKEMIVEVKASRLYERLKEEKNMLLILDDLWEELDLHKVGIPFVDVENYSTKNEGCKMLLTSRDEALLSSRMKCQQIIKVGILSNDEAWELFKRTFELPVDSSIESIAIEIVQRCGGLPLAIATAAKALRVQKIDGWKDYLRRMKHPLTRTITGIKEVDTILRLSYDPLNLEKKKIFLLAAMLSYNPSIEDLLMYSVGLDILKNAENMEEAYNGISTIVSKLKSLNLFLDRNTSSHRFTIHDVFRDVALSIASDELFRAFIVRHTSLNEWPDENKLECCRGVLLQDSDITTLLPEKLHGPLLEFFLLNSKKVDLAIPNMFFESSNKLKLLAFTRLHFSSLPSLRFLQNLKALCLHYCVLEDIIEVGSLRKLKVLSLAHSEIEQLPIELAELTSLQMLNLSHCSKLKVIPQKLLSSLKKLEVLYMRNSFDRWNDEHSIEANENTSLDELKDLPITSLDIHIPNVSMLPDDLFLHMKLERYKIFIGKHWKWWQINDKTSKILRLKIESSIHLKAGIRKLMERVEDLHLCGSNGHENVLYSYDERAFPCLKHLQIESNDDIKHIVLNSEHQEVAFPILESLTLKNLKSLENLCEGPNAVEFPELHTLEMEFLPALTRDLFIKDRAPNHVSNKISKSLFDKVLLPKLKILQLSNLNSLIELIWDDQLSHNSFSNLKKLIVERCGIVKLVPFHVLKSLNNLDVVEVRGCNMLETVFDFEDLNDYEEIVSPSVVVPLKQLKLQRLPKLKNVWSNHYYQGNASFPSLTSVEVSFCKRLTSIFPASIAKEMLHHLEMLSIEGCGIDVIVAKDQVSESLTFTFEFPTLTSLRLARLSKLRNFYPHKHTLELSCLHQLSIECCDELEIFEKEVSSSSGTCKEETTIDSKYPLLSHEKVIRTLEKLGLQGKQVEMIGSGQLQMYHSTKLKQLCLSLEKCDLPMLPDYFGGLQLSGDFEEALGGDNVAALVAPFSKLELKGVSKLSPYLVSSSSLTHLSVQSCYELTTLITSSTARSLAHLMHLSVGYCSKMEEIITMQEGDDDENKEIIFNKLKFLEFKALPRLKRFCALGYPFKFPLLDQIIIEKCPKFKIFSRGIIHTPSLKSVQLWQDWENHHEIWDSNPNKTFYHQRFFVSSELVLDEYDARMIRNDQFQADKYPQVEILHIERFVDEWVTFPYTLLERFPKLNALYVTECSFEEIFPSHTDIADQILAFKELFLANLDKLKNIFPSSTSFDYLTVLKVSRCHRLVYLMTNSTAKTMANLDTLEIDNCKKMKKILRKKTNKDVEGGIVFNGLRILKLTHLPRLKTIDDRKDINTEDRSKNAGCTNVSSSLFNHNKVLLPKLEMLELSNLSNNLISLIWNDQLLHTPFSNLKTLIMRRCDSLKSVPLRVLKSLTNLKNLEVSFCPKLEKVFGYEDLNDYYKEMESSLVVVPLNLTHLEVDGCHGLTTLMTSSAARILVNLTRLSVSCCNQIEEIITKEEGGDDEDKEIHFTQMEFLKLHWLPRLKRFCGYKYSLKFPLLEQVTITECPQLTLFSPQDIHAPQLCGIQGHHEDIWKTDLNNTVQHLFTYQEVISTTRSMALNANNITTVMDVFPKVRDLYVEGFKDEGVTFPYRSLERFPKMGELYVEHSSFEEIFPSQDEIIAFEHNSLEGLYIAYLDKLKSIWKDDSQLHPIHQNLRRLKVNSCCNLAKLAPSSASFKNLLWLFISGCHQLIHLVTISTAKSLVSLKTLSIHDCKKMEEIVMNETSEDVEGGITFNQLRWVVLTDMPSLKMFSSQTHSIEFPMLEEIKITGCPKMKMLCPGVLKTPKMRKVKIEERDIKWEDEEDVNKIIQGLSSSKDSINM